MPADPKGVKDSASGVTLGVVILVAGAIATLTGFFTVLGIPMMAIGGAMIFWGGKGLATEGKDAADRFAQSDTGQAIQSRYETVSSSMTSAAQKNAAKTRARRVITKLREQLEAGAIDENEFSERVRRVNEKIATDLAE